MDTMIATGRPAPDFNLAGLDGRVYSLSKARGRIALVNFWSAECPQSARADRELLAYLEEWGERVLWLSVAANANEPPDLLRRVAVERGLPNLLRDADQQVADLYGAVTTPHFFVIDVDGLLRYQGALDDVAFRQRTPTRLYLRQAVEALLAGKRPDPDQTPVFGCTIVREIP
jgi:peroxiredoxin